MTRSVQSYEDRRAWEEDVLKHPGLSPTQKLVLIRLSHHFNVKTHRCIVGYETLAKGVNANARTAKEAIAVAKREGLIAVTVGGGRENANSYDLLFCSQTVSPDAPFVDATQSETVAAVAETVRERVTNGDPQREKRCAAAHPNLTSKNNLPRNLGDDAATDAGPCRLWLTTERQMRVTDSTPSDELIEIVGKIVGLPPDRRHWPRGWDDTGNLVWQWRRSKVRPITIAVAFQRATTRRWDRGERQPPPTINYFRKEVATVHREFGGYVLQQAVGQ